MLFAFVETSYSESDLKQVDVSSLVLGFGVLRYHALCTLAILHQGPPAWCMMNLVLTDILVSTCISYENSNSWVNLCYNMGWQLWWMEHGEWLLCTLLIEYCCPGLIMYRVGIAMPRCCYRNLTACSNLHCHLVQGVRHNTLCCSFISFHCCWNLG